MNPSRIFIERPVATTLLMVAVLLVGALAYRLLPVSSLPQVDYPTIQVVTLYPGAGPEVMTSSITAPLERQFGQMPGLAQMYSISSGGSSIPPPRTCACPMFAVSPLQRHSRPSVSSTAPPFLTYASTGSAGQRYPMRPSASR